MYVIAVDFTIHSQRLSEFMPLMLENAQVSRDTEPGCLRFDVCRDPARPERVFLYETNTDRSAFDAHLATPHFRSFDARVTAMVASKVVNAYELLSGRAGRK